MTQDMTFLREDGRRIQGRLYLPDYLTDRLPLVIFSHGFGSNFRELMHHGEGFAQAGICCLFFDFCGGGLESLSGGTMEEMTIRSECQDLLTVLACARKLACVDPDRICLLGESMGGLVSAMVAAQCPTDIQAMVLWYPAFGIPEDARRRHAAGEQEVFGLRLGGTFDLEAMALDVYGEIPAYQRPVLLIHGTEDPVVPIAYSRKAQEAYQDARLLVMPGAGHGYEGADSATAREWSIGFIKDCIGVPGEYMGMDP